MQEERLALMAEHGEACAGGDCEGSSSKRPLLTMGVVALACVAMVIVGVVLLSADQGPVALQAAGDGAGYLSAGVEGIAAKVLLEQAQEASELARKRLEEAADAHNKADDDYKSLKDVLASRNTARKESLQDEKDAVSAEKEGAADLLAAKKAHAMQQVHLDAADKENSLAEELSRKAVGFGEEGDRAKASAVEAHAEARKSKIALKRIKAQIEDTLADLKTLRDQLVVKRQYEPYRNMDGQSVPIPRVAMANHGTQTLAAVPRRVAAGRLPTRGHASALADERVPVKVVHDEQAQY